MLVYPGALHTLLCLHSPRDDLIYSHGFKSHLSAMGEFQIYTSSPPSPELPACITTRPTLHFRLNMLKIKLLVLPPPPRTCSCCPPVAAPAPTQNQRH